MPDASETMSGYEAYLHQRCDSWRKKHPDRALGLREWVLRNVFASGPERAAVYKATDMARDMCRGTENALIRVFFGWPTEEEFVRPTTGHGAKK